MRKTTLLVAGTIGYVLGARAGRERYEQIRGTVQRLKSNPTVQQTAQKAADTAKDVAPGVKQKATEAAQSATEKVKGDSSSNGVKLEDTTTPTGGTTPGTSYPQP